jgi:hypothetical protein
MAGAARRVIDFSGSINMVPAKSHMAGPEY